MSRPWGWVLGLAGRSMPLRGATAEAIDVVAKTSR